MATLYGGALRFMHFNVRRYYDKLEIWGRAQHEAARRPKYNLKYIFRSCKVCKNLRGQHP